MKGSRDVIYHLLRSTLKYGRWLNEPITTAHYPTRRLLALLRLTVPLQGHQKLHYTSWTFCDRYLKRILRRFLFLNVIYKVFLSVVRLHGFVPRETKAFCLCSVWRSSGWIRLNECNLHSIQDSCWSWKCRTVFMAAAWSY